jgi:glycosyltransferase involved in cell wall biosynthesis
MKLIAQMVGRNEADRFLVPVLDRLRSIVDQIIFTDDCSTDDTPYIAKAAGASVMQLTEPMFVVDEGYLRTAAWEHLSAHAQRGDWILAIDCDEMLYGQAALPSLLNQSRFDVLGITFYHMWNDTQFRVDKLWAPVTSSRLFRFYTGGEFRKSKLACGSEPEYVQELMRRGRFMPNTPLRMKHLGYVFDDDKVVKHNRYMELDGGSFHNLAHLESILDSHPTLVDWED